MSDLDTRIRSGLERLAEDMTPLGTASDDLLAAISDRRRGRRRTRRLAAATASVVLLVAVAAVAITTVDRTRDDAQVVTDPDPGPDDSALPDAERGPEPLPDDVDETVTGSEAPLSPRNHVAAVWTGSELVLWGGEPGQNDGAAYDPATDSWRVIPPAPLDATQQRWSRAVWTGDEMIVFDGRAAAAWDPRANDWRELPDASGEVGHVVWTGEEVVVTQRSRSGEPGHVAALDPATGAWRELPGHGALEEVDLVWTGDEVIVMGREVGFPFGNVEGWALDPDAGAWRRLPTGPLHARGFGATWVVDRMMVVTYNSEAASYDPESDSWTELPTLPVSFGEGGVAPIPLGDHVLIDGGEYGTIVGDRFGRWVPTPFVGSWGVSTAAGPDLLLHVALVTYPSDGSVDNHPPRVTSKRIADLIDPPAIPLPRALLVLGDSIELVGVEAIGAPPSPSGRIVTVTVDGDECALETRWFETIVGTPAGEAIEITPVHGGGAPWTGYGLDGGRTLLLPEGATWLECDDAERTRIIARALVRDEAAVETDRRRVEQERQRLAELQRELEARRRSTDSE